MMNRVYFDNNATTPLAPEVFEAMRPYLLEDYGNASSIHWFGQRAKAGMEKAREQVARLLGARSSEIVFTSGGTESDNAAILGIVEAARGERKHVVTTAIEHPAVLSTAKALEKRGVSVTYVRVGASGVIDPADVASALRPETVLISVMHANNELGTVQPLEEIGRIARERDIYFHTDAVQSVGKIPRGCGKTRRGSAGAFRAQTERPQRRGRALRSQGDDSAAAPARRASRARSASGHGKRGGDRGAGRRGGNCTRAPRRKKVTALPPCVTGWKRAFSPSVPCVAVNGDRTHRVPNTTNLTFDYIEGEGFVIAMDLRGIACSTGSACSSGSLEPSHVLSAIGLRPEQARASIRFSLGRFNTDEDVDAALRILPGVVEQLRAVSPHYRKEAVSSQPSAVSKS